VRAEHGRALQVLVVDDDDADALMIEEALTSSDVPATVYRVADGYQAMAYLRDVSADAARPDLILLDLNMPKMSGHQVLAHIKNDDTLKAIPVVVLTTSDADTDVRSSYQQRANAYVKKPIDLDAFEVAVQEINAFYRDVAVLPR
jgi:CheY-like chemotaxis protein